MTYDPENYEHRQILATEITRVLDQSGFVDETEQHPRTRERVYSRQVDRAPEIRVLVYTTIEGGAVRACAKDSIKVCAVYRTKDGQDRGIISASTDKVLTGRVHRVGEIGAVVTRMLDRMRTVFGAARTPNRCRHCGAPTFKSKARKAKHGRPAKPSRTVCAEVCWTKRNAA
jgi:hypothetical protein